ncbi:DMT family transporter [Segnochrobactraceae bacterium EtOH-i3]
MRGLVSGVWARPITIIWLPPALWAGNMVLGRALAADFPPVSLAVFRWLITLALILPFVGRLLWQQRAIVRREGLMIVACGAFGIAGYNALAYVALKSVPAANVAFLNSTLPLMVPVFAFVLGVERVGRRTLFGLVVSSFGVAWLMTGGNLAAITGLSFSGGEGLVLIAISNYAIYSVLLRRMPADLNPFVFFTATVIAGLVVLAPFWIAELAAGAILPTDPASWAAVAYLGVFASLVAFLLWMRCVAVLGSTITGTSFHLMAVFTAAFAWAALGEPLESYHFAGIGLILLGVFCATIPLPAGLLPGTMPRLRPVPIRIRRRR